MTQSGCCGLPTREHYEFHEAKRLATNNRHVWRNRIIDIRWTADETES